MAHPLEAPFQAAMMDIYRRAKNEARYNATRFLRMVGENGGYETALHLLRASETSDGFAALWERGRLDLTVEALVLQDRWRDLFSEEELAVAGRRLQELGSRTD
jgi:hypothetical protein